MSIVSVRDLAVSLGGREVLSGVTLALNTGEFVGLLGPNGAGKTTLMRSILGLVRPTRGTVRLAGASPRHSRSTVGYVPQRHEFAWNFPISVERVVLTGRSAQLGLWRRPTTLDWDAVDRALELVGLTELRTRPVSDLSGGQRQRVLVARALALEPSLLLLDEPFTGLDLPTQDQLAELFATLAGEDRAVMMSTHDVLSAHHGCSRLILLNRRIVADGAPSELDRSAWKQAFELSDTSPLLSLVEAGR